MAALPNSGEIFIEIRTFAGTIRAMTTPEALLNSIGNGDLEAKEHLFSLVYGELRKLAAVRMAHERPNHTLSATALVHEVWFRLCGDSTPQVWDGKAHFFAAAAESMRRILIDHARHHKSQKAGGQYERVRLSVLDPASSDTAVDLLELNDVLDKLAQVDSRKAELVKLRFFAGLTNQEAAAVLGISTSTADNDWAYARSWLRVELDENRERDRQRGEGPGES